MVLITIKSMTSTQSDRLDRIEALVESNAKAIEAAASERQELRALVESNAKAIEAAASDRATLRTSIDDLARVAGESIRHMQEMQADIREMQSEVRGLQLENRRMLDHLFGQNGNNSPD